MSVPLKLGLALSWDKPKVTIPMEKVLLAEALGFDSVWSAEAYGSDAFTPLVWVAAHTSHLRLGTSVMQVAARPPASVAMQMATLDDLSGGRMIGGFGLSGPQIVEGWYGQPWGVPNQRLRDYLQIIRKVLRREGPVTHNGKEIRLPYDGEGSSGLGKPLKCILHTNPDIPLWVGSGGRANVILTAELADGWLPFGFVPGSMKMWQPLLEEGFKRAGKGKSLKDFEIQAGCQLYVTDDVKSVIDSLKPTIALYVGGMGHPKLNFHKQMMARRGYPEAAERIQELFLGGDRTAATAAVPDEYVDEGALIGPAERIRERYRAWQDSGATGLTVHCDNIDDMRLLAEIAELKPRNNRV